VKYLNKAFTISKSPAIFAGLFLKPVSNIKVPIIFIMVW